MDELSLTATHNIDPDRYRSYMVRLWREAPDASWRCQVQCVGTDREQRFAGLEAMFEFLIADAAGESERADAKAESSDTAWEGQGAGSSAPEMPGS